MSNKLDFIFERRSIRSYQNKEVPKSYIKQILEAGMAAPSAVAKDPWRFIVVETQEMLDKISQHLPNGKMLSSSAFGIVVCGEQKAAHRGLEGYMVQDCSAAIQNMLLAVHALDLGACWLGVYPVEERIKALQKECEIPENITPLSVLAIGYPDEKKDARTRYNDEFVRYEKWSNK